jgi:hypothetical protein
MKTFMRFCTHLECNSLNTCRNEKRFQQTLQREMKHIYVQSTFFRVTVSVHPACFTLFIT